MNMFHEIKKKEPMKKKPVLFSATLNKVKTDCEQ